MISEEDQPKKSVEKNLEDAIKYVDAVVEKVGQYVGQRLTSKQYHSLTSDLSALKQVLCDVDMGVKKSTDDSCTDDRERFSTMTSGTGSTLDGSEFEREHFNQSDLIERLRADNQQLQEEIRELEQELNKSMREQTERILDGSFSGHSNSGIQNCSADLVQTTQELSRCKETLQAMKADRRKLKSDNLDLHLQMKQLYMTLGDKESELRDFIRNYDQRKQDYADATKKVIEEKEKLESEKKDLTRRTREAFENNLMLRSQLDHKESQLMKLEQEFRKVLSQQRSATLNSVVKGCLSEDSLMRQLISNRGPTYDPLMAREPPICCSSSYSTCGLNTEDIYSRCDDSFSRTSDGFRRPADSYQHIYQTDCSPTLLPRTASMTEGQMDASRENALMLARLKRPEQIPSINRSLSSGFRDSFASTVGQRTSLGITIQSSTINEVDSQTHSPPPLPPVPACLSFLSPDNYQDKMRTLEEAKLIPVSQWKAHHVLAWIELEMNVSAFGPACSANIKSGKVLLGLSDAEIESALRLTSPLHRRKMRLAIEDLRDPSSIQFRYICAMDHIWVSHEWIYSLGLPQHSSAFEEQLVDGRLLRVLSKKDLDKYLGIRKKFHQSSFQYGVDLLHMMEFDKEALQERRNQSKLSNGDPLLWSNQQVIQWAERIDLQEYSRNLRESGVHGALLVLDTNFTADVLASILGIASSKSYVRRHLAEELEAIVRPARAALESFRPPSNRNSSGFVRAFSSSNRHSGEVRDSSRSSGSTKRMSLRGSFGRAFGRKASKESPAFNNESRESI